MPAKLLIVEDDKELQKVLVSLLQSEGFVTEAVSTGSKALQKLDRSQPDLLLLDLGLPDIQGETILEAVRKSYSKVPVVILTAKSKPQEIAEGLNLGADDYLPKPFAVEELLARINARLKGAASSNSKILPTVGGLKLDLVKMVAVRNGKKIDLTRKEFDLLLFLLENKGRVLSRDLILNHVWAYPSEVESRVVDIYIGYLRKKIDGDTEKKLIKNKRGFGYYISD